MCSWRLSPALLDEDHLIDARLLEAAQVLAQLVGRADAAASAGVGQQRRAPSRSGPDVGAPGLVGPEDVVVAEPVAEEAEAVLAAPARLRLVLVAGEARHHGDVGVDRVADRHALAAG